MGPRSDTKRSAARLVLKIRRMEPIPSCPPRGLFDPGVSRPSTTFYATAKTCVAGRSLSSCNRSAGPGHSTNTSRPNH